MLPGDFEILEKPKVENQENNAGENAPVIKAVGEVNWIDLQFEQKESIDLSTWI